MNMHMEMRRTPDMLDMSEQPVSHDQPCQSIDWYAEGEGRVVEVGGVRVTIRLVGRKGRRSRIVIAAPTGARFAPEQRADFCKG
jgi:hypothetical protein